ncbi:adenosylcobinamide-GDP ribazoletransferase [Piscinibacter koreensis]|uniref:Adenosylcobinamide-GDP ribazoletransferase n=1 Tax=Piscinibacter koreensis TaxID=2742824 RepID=A0A7Y6NP51_9BURK|nr:adenosylcobinamide-GDP ribazoletransferase [Schlegelella koreensis]NUZ06781.1 adenosylcobinamide-GDP ribazoletransferase [Schlegelella koreensis]
MTRPLRRVGAAARHERRLFFIALQFLTRIPIPGWVGFEPALLNRAVRQFPQVGALVGFVGGSVVFVAQQLWTPGVAAVLAVTATVWLTAAFHEDGLADTFDALLGAASREKALAIMKDSRIGTYGASALVVTLLLRVLLVAELVARDPLVAALAVVASHAGGRAAAVVLMASVPYAGEEAHAKAKPLARHARRIDAVAAAVAGVAWLWPAAAAATSGPIAALLRVASLTAALAALVLGLRAWLRRRLGGYTGDTLGAAAQFGELVVLLGVAARMPG